MLVKNVGVISIVEWRQNSVLKTLESIKKQTLKLDELLIIADGFSCVLPTWVYNIADKVDKIENKICSNGSWNRFEHAMLHFSPLDILFTFDDDLMYPPKYIEDMLESYKRLQAPLSHGGIEQNGIMHHFVQAKIKDIKLIELSLGISVIPLSSLIGIQNSEVVQFLKNADAETAIGYWWYKNKIDCYLVKTEQTVSFVPEAQDPRCLYKTYGGHDGMKKRWVKFRKNFKWPLGQFLPRYC